MLGRKKKPAADGDQSPYEAYTRLRTMALDAVTHGLPSPTRYHPDVSGLVVDVPAQGGWASLVAMTDGTTSLYTSVGGGTIGAGAHAPVAVATRRLLSAVQADLDGFLGWSDQELPPPGTVRLHVLSPSIPRTTDVPEAAFWGEVDHPLRPVIVAVHDVLTAVRTASPT